MNDQVPTLDRIEKDGGIVILGSNHASMRLLIQDKHDLDLLVMLGMAILQARIEDYDETGRPPILKNAAIQALKSIVPTFGSAPDGRSILLFCDNEMLSSKDEEKDLVQTFISSISLKLTPSASDAILDQIKKAFEWKRASMKLEGDT